MLLFGIFEAHTPIFSEFLFKKKTIVYIRLIIV